MKRSKIFFCGCSNEEVLKSYELVLMDLGVSRNIPRSRASELDMASFLMMRTYAPVHFDSPGFHCALTIQLISSLKVTPLVTNTL